MSSINYFLSFSASWLLRPLVLLLLFSSSVQAGTYSGNAASTAEQSHVAREWANKRAVKFVENKGQLKDTRGNAVPHVLFKVTAPDMDVYITESGLTYSFSKVESIQREKSGSVLNASREAEILQFEQAWFNVRLEGATIKKENIIREGESHEFFNYYLAHCPDGIYGVKEYEKITIKAIYPGIDWVFYKAEKTGMKYDFIVHPGASVSDIKMVYDSENPLKINRSGGIEITTSLGTMEEKAPYSYFQQSNDEVASKYIAEPIDAHHTRVRFLIDTNSAKEHQISPLVIDPQLTWGTFYGGAKSWDEFFSASVDAKGNLYVAGRVSDGLDFPVHVGSGAFLGAYFDTMIDSVFADVCILRFNAAGVLEWAVMYGGSSAEECNAIVHDASENVYLTGSTSSPNFPTQKGAGAYLGAYLDNSWSGKTDAFMLRFNNQGVRQWATLYGGSDAEIGRSVIVDNGGNLYVAGVTRSPDFLLSQGKGAFSGAYFDNTIGSSVPGSSDAFLLRFNATGDLEWSTFYGGTNDEWANGVATDLQGNVYVTGITLSTDLPTQKGLGAFSGAYYDGTKVTSSMGNIPDGFMLRFNNTGNLEWSTYGIGGNMLVVDNMDNIYASGTVSFQAPRVIQPGIGKFSGAYLDTVLSNNEGHLVRVNNKGVLEWATYYGGSDFDVIESIALDKCGNLYVLLEEWSSSMKAQKGCSGYFDDTYAGSNSFPDQFLSQFSPRGHLLWSTFVGGSGDERVGAGNILGGMTIDKQGNVFIVGQTNNVGTNDFPLQDPGSGAYYDDTHNGSFDGFVWRFSPIPPVYSVSKQESICGCNGAAIIKGCATSAFDYSWNTGKTTIATAVNADTLKNLCPGNYWVEVKSNCLQTDTFHFNIIDKSYSLSLKTSSTISCNDKDGSASVTSNGGVLPYSYTWNGVTGSTSTISGLSPGLYTVVVKDKNGCSTTGTVTILADGLDAGYTTSPAEPPFDPSQHILFQNTTVNGKSYFWDFGDGTSDTQENPIHSYDAPGKYTVLLVSKSINGCLDTAVSVLEIGNLLLIPNVFTPNGDGQNDVFKMNSFGIKSLSISIYNRWGEIQFESTSLHPEWDGMNKHGEIIDGTYFYVVHAESKDNKTMERSGFITLLKNIP